MRLYLLCIGLFFRMVISVCSQPVPPVYKDFRQPVDVRVRDLLSRMTLDEKLAQTQCIWLTMRNGLMRDEQGNFDSLEARKAYPHGLGQIARPSENFKTQGTPGRTPRETAVFTNAAQKYFMEQTRLGIPVIFHEEALHGHPAQDATSFPQSIGLASTWDEELMRRIFTIVAYEVRVRGGHQVLAPVVDIARDPRWGRFEETYGEDPYLVSRMGVAAVKGFQGELGTWLDARHVLATLKHMTGHGQPEAGTNTAPANLGERTIREIFLPPFQAAIREAHAQSVMASYNEIDGVPSHASEFLLKKILRDEWGFKGYVVSDYFAVAELFSRHKVASSDAEAAALAFRAGVDIETPDPTTYGNLKRYFESGKISVAVLDSAVVRLLRGKFRLGLFERPYTDPDEAERVIGSAAHAAVALEAAQKSIVLLENKKHLLPLNLTTYKKIAVIGPNANRSQLGGYSDVPKHVVTLLEGVQSVVGTHAQVLYSEGCRIVEDNDPFRWYRNKITLPNPADEQTRLAQAIETARSCDLIILALGSDEALSREGWAEDHLGDHSSLDLPGNQLVLLRELKKLGKPLVVTLFNGAPLALQPVQEQADALLECWYAGQEGGKAVAQVLFGQVNPSGKLPCTFPRSAGHIPAFYNYKPSARRGYHFEDVSPLYPFGYGLSYTTFSYSKPTLSVPFIHPGEPVTARVTVTNTGKIAGEEVVQLYIRDVVSSVTRPVRELKGFKRVKLQPGQSQMVTFTLTPDKLSFWNLQMQFVTEPGDFEIMTGRSSALADLQTVVLKVNE